jgi:hypothetical protein
MSADPSDPFDLDADGDGEACNSLRDKRAAASPFGSASAASSASALASPDPQLERDHNAASPNWKFVRFSRYITCTPPKISGPLLLVVASLGVCLMYAVLATSGYMPQQLTSDCGSREGRGIEPRRSPSLGALLDSSMLPSAAIG